jgi:hypothetical protein
MPVAEVAEILKLNQQSRASRRRGRGRRARVCARFPRTRARRDGRARSPWPTRRDYPDLVIRWHHLPQPNVTITLATGRRFLAARCEQAERATKRLSPLFRSQRPSRITSAARLHRNQGGCKPPSSSGRFSGVSRGLCTVDELPNKLSQRGWRRCSHTTRVDRSETHAVNHTFRTNRYGDDGIDQPRARAGVGHSLFAQLDREQH